MKEIKPIKNLKTKHVVISDTNYYKLKSLGRMGDTFDKVLAELLLKNQMLESDSRVATRNQQTLTILTPPEKESN